MIQDVLMDWYEEVVLVVEVSPNKQHRFEREDGWLIMKQLPYLLAIYLEKTQKQNSNELGGKKQGSWTSIVVWTWCV